MYDFKKADEIYHKKLEENPEYDHELVMEWIHDMPHQFAQKMYEEEYGCHIFDKEMYDEAVSYFENPNGTEGAHWDVDTIRMKSGIDFNTFKAYTLWDFAYMVNEKYSDYGDFLATDMLFKMAKRDLEDKDYPGEASERAYKDAKKRIRYFKAE